MAIEIVSFPSYKMVIFHSYVNVYQRVPSYTIIYHHIPSYTIWDIYDLYPHIYGFLPCVDRKLCCGDGDTTETVWGQQFTAIRIRERMLQPVTAVWQVPNQGRAMPNIMAYHGIPWRSVWKLRANPALGFESSVSWIFQDHCGTAYRILQSHMGGLCHGSPGQFTWDS